MLSSLALILWLVLILLCLSVIIVSGIVACCLKERKQLYAVDTLLIAATALIAVTLSVNLILPGIQKKPSTKKYQKAVKLADAAVDDIEESAYLEELSEPAHTILSAFASSKVDKLLGDAEKTVQKQVDNYPDGIGVNARLAIIFHAEGKDPAAVFEHFQRVGGEDNPLNEVLQQIYRKPEDNADDDYNMDQATEVIKHELPKGWYQTVTLMDLYKKYDPATYKKELEKRTENAHIYAFRVQSFLIVDAILCIVGVVSLVLFARQKPIEPSEVIPLTTNFRRMYACLISTIFAQVIAGGVIGVWIGISSVLSHASSDLSDYESLMSGTLIISGVIFCLLMVYMLVLKPQKLSLNEAFTRSAITLTPLQFASYWVGAFCAGNLLNVVGRILYHLLPGAGRPTNPAHLDMVKAFTTGDVEMMIKSVVFACLLAPVTEEILFRGLLFGWLRYKFGVIPAVLGSSILFAAWHFDLNGFVQYFALGLVLATVYSRTRNLWLSMMIHGLWNLWVVSTVWWVTSYHH